MMNELSSSPGDDYIKVLKPSLDDFIDLKRYLVASVGDEPGEVRVIKIVPPKEWLDGFTNQGENDVGDVKDFEFQFKQFNIEDVSSGRKQIFKFSESESIKRNVIENFKIRELYKKCNNSNSNNKEKDSDMADAEFWNGLDDDILSYCGVCDIDLDHVRSLPSDLSIGTLTKSLFGDDGKNSGTDNNTISSKNNGNNNSNSNNSKGNQFLVGSINSCKIINSEGNEEKYRINYIHKGSSKHWYIVDHKYIENYNELVKDISNKSDKIIIKPDFLKEKNIHFHHFIQHANEFIILLPSVSISYVIDNGENLSELLDISQLINLSISVESGQQSNSKYQNEMDDIKAKQFGELLDHSSNELSQLEEKNASTNSLLNFPNYNLVQSGSLRLENNTPTQYLNNVESGLLNNNTGSSKLTSIDGKNGPASNSDLNTGNSQVQQIQQHQHNYSSTSTINHPNTISRISSPLLSRMMDLSNIVEPTLEDPTLRFKRKVINMNPSNTNNSASGSNLAKYKVNIKHQNSSIKPNTGKELPAQGNMLLEDEEDNMLALSLASMANSRAASPRLTLPPISSSMDSNSMIMNMGNNGFLTNESSPGISSTSLSMDQSLARNNATSSSIISPKPLHTPNAALNTNNPSNIASGVHKNMPPIPSSPSSSKLSFMKRLKSPNIVTLNISRENSRSPVSLVGDYRSPLGVLNPITYSTTNSISSLSQLHQLEFSANHNRINGSHINPNENTMGPTSSLSNVIAAVNSTSSPPPSKKQKIEKKSGFTVDSKKKNYTNTIPQTKFASDEIVMSENGKVYICQECKRQFSSGHHLTRHKKSVHSGEKPHSCPKCGKRFKRRDHVLQHLNKKIPCTQEGGAKPEKAAKTPKARSVKAKEEPTNVVDSTSNVPTHVVHNEQESSTVFVKTQPTGSIGTVFAVPQQDIKTDISLASKPEGQTM